MTVHAPSVHLSTTAAVVTAAPPKLTSTASAVQPGQASAVLLSAHKSCVARAGVAGSVTGEPLSPEVSQSESEWCVVTCSDQTAARQSLKVTHTHTRHLVDNLRLTSIGVLLFTGRSVILVLHLNNCLNMRNSSKNVSNIEWKSCSWAVKTRGENN